MTLQIGSRRLGDDDPVFVIAEVGVNHNGDPDLALELVVAGAAAGADAVKFQAFAAERLVAAEAPKAAYQLETTPKDESQLTMLRQLELAPEALRSVADECRARGVEFMASVFDDENIRLVDMLDASAIKIGSGELTNAPLLEAAAATGRPIVLSTGMADMDEVDEAVTTLRAKGVADFALLHCVSQYPAEAADANLRAIATMRDRFEVPVGFSDHTLGRDAAIAAVALGASIVEKHLTLDSTLAGPDHRASLEPEDFASFVDAIRSTSAALGDGVKRPAASEAENRLIVRRSLVASRDLSKGTLLEADMLAALRPGTGIAPKQRPDVVGRRLLRSVAAGEQITWGDLD